MPFPSDPNPSKQAPARLKSHDFPTQFASRSSLQTKHPLESPAPFIHLPFVPISLASISSPPVSSPSTHPPTRPPKPLPNPILSRNPLSPKSTPLHASQHPPRLDSPLIFSTSLITLPRLDSISPLARRFDSAPSTRRIDTARHFKSAWTHLTAGSARVVGRMVWVEGRIGQDGKEGLGRECEMGEIGRRARVEGDQIGERESMFVHLRGDEYVSKCAEGSVVDVDEREVGGRTSGTAE